MFLGRGEVFDTLSNYQKELDIIRHNDIQDLQQFSNLSNVSWPTGKNTISKLLTTNIISEDFNEGSIRKYSVCTEYVSFGIAIGATRTKLSLIGLSMERIEIVDNPLYVDLVEALIHHQIVRLPDDHNSTNDKKYFCCETKDSFSDIKLMINNILKAVMDFFSRPSTKQQCLVSIGIALPGIIDKKSHVLTFSPRISSLSYVYVYDLIDDELQTMMNDNNIAFGFFHDTVASVVYEKEYLYGLKSKERNQRDKPSIAAIYMGSGLGAGFVLQNSLATRALAEYGHVFAFLPDKYIIKLEDLEQGRINLNDKEREILNDYYNIIPCACGNKYCFENLIRQVVFKSKTPEEYIANTSRDALDTFAEKEPERYELLKHLISLMLNSIINVLDVDLVVFTGRIFCCLPQLQKDLDDLKMQSALKQLSVHCRILKGSNELDSVASGAAIMSYHKIFSKDDDVEIHW